MKDVLTYSQMEHQYPDEWVLVGDPKTDDSLNVLSGVVLWHSRDRDELYRKAIELRPRNSAILCFAIPPDDAEFMLPLRELA